PGMEIRSPVMEVRSPGMEIRSTGREILSSGTGPRSADVRSPGMETPCPGIDTLAWKGAPGASVPGAAATYGSAGGGVNLGMDPESREGSGPRLECVSAPADVEGRFVLGDLMAVKNWPPAAVGAGPAKNPEPSGGR